MKAALLHSLYLEVKDEYYPDKYSGLEIMEYAVRRLGGDSGIQDVNYRERQYEQLEGLYDLSYDVLDSLFIPYKMYGQFPDLLDTQRLESEPFGVYPKCFDWAFYREAWLTYFPGWFALWGWHEDDFQDCAYWVLSLSDGNECKQVSIYYGLEEDARETLILMSERVCHQYTTRASRFDSHVLAQTEKSLLQSSVRKIRPIVNFD